MAMDYDKHTMVMVPKPLRSELAIAKIKFGVRSHYQVIEMALEALWEKNGIDPNADAMHKVGISEK